MSGKSRDRRYLSHMITNLAGLWDEETFCDITLLVDGQRFRAHRLVLSAASLYFKSMFTLNFKEKVQDEVEIKQIDADVFEMVLEYIYKGTFLKSMEKPAEIVDILKLMQFDSALEFYWKFLSENVSQLNCCYLYKLAVFHDEDELSNIAQETIKNNFDSMSPDELLDSTEEILFDCLKSNTCKKTEKARLDIIVAWITYRPDEHAQAIVKLLDITYMGMIEFEHLEEAFRTLSPLVPENQSKYFDAMFKRTITYHKGITIKAFCKDIMQMRFQRKELHCSAKTPVVFAKQTMLQPTWVGLLKNEIWDRDFDSCYMYIHQCERENEIEDSNLSKWMVKGEANPLIQDAGTCQFRNFFFVCGGVTKHKTISNRCFMYDPRLDRWNEFNRMNYPRAKFALVELKGHLYAIGGLSSAFVKNKDYHTKIESNSYIHPVYSISSVEQYTAETDSWLLFDFLPFPMRRPFALSVHGYVYLFFGETNAPSDTDKLPHTFIRYDVSGTKSLKRIHDFNHDSWIDEGIICPCGEAKWATHIAVIDTASGTEIYLPLKGKKPGKKTEPKVVKVIEYRNRRYDGNSEEEPYMPLPLGACPISRSAGLYLINGSVGGEGDFRTSSHILHYEGESRPGFSALYTFRADRVNDWYTPLACMVEGIEVYYGAELSLPLYSD